METNDFCEKNCWDIVSEDVDSGTHRSGQEGQAVHLVAPLFDIRKDNSRRRKTRRLAS